MHANIHGRVYFAVIVLSGVAISLTAAQSADHDGTTLPLAIDGSVTPEKIPDAIASRHFVMAAATTEVPSRAERDKLEGLISELGLGAGDRAVLFNALSGTRERIDSIGKKISAESTASQLETLAALHHERAATLDSIFEQLRAALSVQGRSQLRKYIDSMKRDIRVFATIQ